MSIDTIRPPLLPQSGPGTRRAEPEATGSDCGLRHVIRSCKAAVRRVVASRPACIDMLPRILLCCIPSAKGSEARAQIGVWRAKRDEQAQFDAAVKMTLATGGRRDNKAQVFKKWILAGAAADKTKAMLRGLSKSEQPQSPPEPDPPNATLSKLHFSQLVDLSRRLKALLASIGTEQERLNPEAVDFLRATARHIRAEYAHRRGAFDDVVIEQLTRQRNETVIEGPPVVRQDLSSLITQTVTLARQRGAHGESIENYLNGLTRDRDLYDASILARAYTSAVAAVGVTEMTKSDRTTAQAIAKQLNEVAQRKLVEATSHHYQEALTQGYSPQYAASAALSMLYDLAPNITGVLGPETTQLVLRMHAEVLGRRERGNV